MTRVFLEPGATHTVKRVLAARPESVAEARREVVSLAIPQAAREQLALVVSELVTNAVLHAGAAPGDAVRLEIRVRSGRARIEVRDGGLGFDAPSVAPDPPAVGGLGLVVVAALAETWGVVRESSGCTVWCELLVEEPASVVDQEVTDAYVRELAGGMTRTTATGLA